MSDMREVIDFSCFYAINLVAFAIVDKKIITITNDLFA